jgi:hypothetical protein
MVTRDQILKQLPPFENRRDILVNDQDVADIITGILATHKKYGKQYDTIAPYFEGRNNYETGRNIWSFLKNNVRYKVEPESAQMLKSPAAIITGYIDGRKNSSDCKNMSLFTGGVLDALNRRGVRINWAYRFASYKLWDKVPQHVFVVINPDTKNEIWVDAVLPGYDYKKQYYYKTDRNINNMALVALSGTMAGKKQRQQKKAEKKAGKQAKKTTAKEKRKQFFKKLKEKAKKAGKLILKYNPATAASRNAFILLVKVNARSVATNLKKLKDRGNTEAQTLWGKIGGNVATLNAAIDSGAKKKRLGVIMGPPVQTSSQQERTGFKGETMSLKELRDRSIREKADRFTSPTGGRVRSLVTIKTIRKPTGNTEAALTAFVPTVVAPVVPSTPTGGRYGGGGNSYPGYDDAPTEETIATEQIDESLLENIDDEGNVIGAEPAVTAAAIAAAAPIVALIVKILAKNKVSTGADNKNLTDDLTKATEQAGEEAMADIDKEADGILTPTGDKILEGTKSQPTPAGGKFPIMPALLVGGGLLAFTLLKKRK